MPWARWGRISIPSPPGYFMGEVTLFMWICLAFTLLGGPTAVFLFFDWVGRKRLIRKVRREERERNSVNM